MANGVQVTSLSVILLGGSLLPMMAAGLVARPLGSSPLPARPALALAREPAEAPSGTISGRILGETGTAVARARVAVYGQAASAVPVRETMTDATGGFWLGGMEKGAYRVVAEHEEAGLVESAELALADRGIPGLVLVLSHTVERGGLVIDPAGRPVARATVRLEAASPWLSRVATTDERGQYVLRFGATETGFISAWARGYAAVRAPIALTDPTIRLAPAPRQAGVVVDPTGQGVGGARVLACDGEERESTYSDPGGRFELSAMTTGCSARAARRGFGLSAAIRLVAGSPALLRLEPSGRIEGMVVGDSGEPLTDYVVSVVSFRPLQPGPSVGARSGRQRRIERGPFRFEGLDPGTYVIGAAAEGMEPSESDPIEIRPGRVVDGIRLLLAPENVDPAEADPQEESGRSLTERARRALDVWYSRPAHDRRRPQE